MLPAAIMALRYLAYLSKPSINSIESCVFAGLPPNREELPFQAFDRILRVAGPLIPAAIMALRYLAFAPVSASPETSAGIVSGPSESAAGVIGDSSGGGLRGVIGGDAFRELTAGLGLAAMYTAVTVVRWGIYTLHVLLAPTVLSSWYDLPPPELHGSRHTPTCAYTGECMHARRDACSGTHARTPITRTHAPACTHSCTHTHTHNAEQQLPLYQAMDLPYHVITLESISARLKSTKLPDWPEVRTHLCFYNQAVFPFSSRRLDD